MLSDSGEPNEQIIIQGLDAQVDELILHKYIVQKGGDIDSCVIIRDRDTKLSRGFGFIRFFDIEAATRFLEEYKDGGLQINEGKLRIAYSRDIKDEDGWTCKNCGVSNYARRESCFKCAAPKADSASDTSTLPSQFIQLRGLHQDTPELISRAMKKLEVPIRRVLSILPANESRLGKEKDIFAFVEYGDANAAGRALTNAASLPGKGFTIGSKPVQLSFIHSGVFVPVYGVVKPGVFKASGSEQLLRYWNEDLIVSTFIPEDALPDIPMDASSSASSKRKTDAEGNKRKKLKVLGSEAKGGMISHWSRKQTELNGGEVDGNGSVDYADLNLMACLLCSRRFKTEPEIRKHERLSDLHTRNLSDSRLVEKARRRLKERTVNAMRPTPAEAEDESDRYRDRAMERRRTHGQPSGPSTIANDARKMQRSPSPEGPVAAVENKGAKLLGKMGWSAGQGLGREGEGRKEAIEADQYVPGAGLGARGAKLPQDRSEHDHDRDRAKTGEYHEYVLSVRDRARSRFDA